jgi:2-phosphoglycerate kinase
VTSSIKFEPSSLRATATGGLIIGGSSSVGKTTVARALAARFHATHIETDRSLPADARLRPLDGSDEVWDSDPARLCERLIHAAAAAIPYLLDQITALNEASKHWILEGERVHPQLIEQAARAANTRGVVIIETDAQRLFQTLHERLPRFHTLLASRQRAVAEVDRLYNLWLSAESARRGVICIASQPWSTLAERVLSGNLDR